MSNPFDNFGDPPALRPGVNPFDQFNAPDEANPFAQFDAPPSTATKEPDLLGTVADMGRTAVAEGVRFAGNVGVAAGRLLQGAGDAADSAQAAVEAPSQPLRAPEAQPLGRRRTAPEEAPLTPGVESTNPLQVVGDAATTAANWIKSFNYPLNRKAEEESQPSGNLLEPSTWSMGKNPSPRGYAMVLSGLYGQLAPVVMSGIVAGAPGGMVVGGLGGGGAAIDEAQQTIDRMIADGSIRTESRRFNELLTAGLPEDIAAARVRQEAADLAFILTLPVSALSGAVTGKIVHPATGLLATRAAGTRIGGRALISGAEETVSEVTEGLTTNVGVNVAAGVDRDIWEGSFANALLGFAGGASIGGATAGRRQPEMVMPTPRDIERVLNDMKAGVTPSNPGLPPGERLRQWMAEAFVGSAIHDPVVAETMAQVTSRAAEREAPIWYSNAIRAAEARLPPSGTPAQMLATLQNTPGVKQEELDATGLTAFLSQGNKVTRAEILEYLEENQIQVNEVLRQRTPRDEIKWRPDPERPGTFVEEYGDFEIRPHPNGEFQVIHFSRGSGAVGAVISVQPTFDAASTVAQRASDRLAAHDYDALTPHHEDYTMPGARRFYKELLLTLPKIKPVHIKAKEEEHVRLGQELALEQLNSQREAEILLRMLPLERELNDYHRNNPNFTGSHWDEPNVVAHIRFSERIDKTGRVVLHIEEIQSDWHQQGRKKGYGPTPMPKWASVVHTKMAPGQFDNIWKLTSTDGTVYTAVGVRTAEDAIAQTERGIDSVRRPPDAPFKTSWPELSMKRMLRWAADNGYSRITWNNGELAARYAAGGVTDAKVKAGLNEFYNKIVPSIAKRLMKKYGGVVGVTSIETGTRRKTLDALRPVQVGRDWGVLGPDGVRRQLMGEIEVDGDPQPYWARSEDEVLEWIAKQRKLDDPFSSIAFMDVPERAKTYVQQGLPVFQTTSVDATRVVLDPETTQRLKTGDPFTISTQQAVRVFDAMARKFGLETKLTLRVKKTPPKSSNAAGSIAMATAQRHPNGSYTITMYTDAFQSVENYYASIMHEFGHVVFWEHFQNLPQKDKFAILQDYHKTFDPWRRSDKTIEDVLKRRSAAAFIQGLGSFVQALNELSPEQRDYWYRFEEWFADQVARWATTEEKPLTLAERVYKGIADKLLAVFEEVSKAFNLNFRPAETMKAWLDSFIDSAPPLAAKVYDDIDIKTKAANQNKIDEIDPGLEAAPESFETAGIRNVVNAVAPTLSPQQAQALRQQPALADKFNQFYRLMVHAFQLGELNPGLVPYQSYLENLRAAGVDESKINDAALRLLKEWDNLGRKQGEALAGLLDEVTNMNYLTPAERARGVTRHPTPAELQTIATRYGVSRAGLIVFDKIRVMFDKFLDFTSQLAIRDAMKLTDPLARANAVTAIQNNVANLRAKPYFPFMRFGRFVAVVKNAAGVTVHREHFERRGLNSGQAQLNKALPRLQAAFGTGFTVEPVVIPESGVPMMMMPTTLLDSIQQKLTLTPFQQQALEQIRLDLAPSQSFRHRFQNKKYIPGYSQDFKRAFGQYFFSGAKWYIKVKYAEAMREDIKNVRASTRNSLTPVKRQEIANFMEEHLEKAFLNPAQDFITFKAFLVFMTLGYVPVSAVVNMSQTPMVTFPYLSDKFGLVGVADVRVAKEMAKAMLDWRNFYKKGAYSSAAMPSADMKAIDYAIKTGRLDQTLAGELAGWGQSSNLGTGYAGTTPARVIHAGMNYAMKMFELAEKWNQRVAFIATLRLARAKPNQRFVRETVAKYPKELAEMITKGFLPAEAQAIIVANHVVEQTQLMVTQVSRPKFMRGKFGSLWLYKRFIQGLLFLMANNKTGFLPRFLILMLYVGGLHGVPGYDDLEEAVRLLAWQLYGKDYKLSRELREYMKTINDPLLSADQILHGTSRMGFGVPWLLNAMGNQLGVPKDPVTGKSYTTLPRVDMSRSIGPGPIFPAEVGKLFGPPINDPSKTFGEQGARVGGVMGNLAHNWYKAIASKDGGDLKRWEGMMPRFARNLSHSYRAFTEGRERGRSDVSIIPFNINDPEHRAEALAIAGGFQPRRLTATWNELQDQGEVLKFISVNRDLLLEQWAKAFRDQDPKQAKRMNIATAEFNNNLPPWAKTRQLTGDTIKRSVETRLRTQLLFEEGLSPQLQNIPIIRHIQGLHPEAVIESRRVR